MQFGSSVDEGDDVFEIVVVKLARSAVSVRIELGRAEVWSVDDAEALPFGLHLYCVGDRFAVPAIAKAEHDAFGRHDVDRHTFDGPPADRAPGVVSSRNPSARSFTPRRW